MKEELEVTFKIPDRFVNLNDEGEYYIPENFPYDKVVTFIKDFSMTYYGIDVDVDEKDLKPTQSKITPSKWSITHKWIDTPDYSRMSSMLYELSNFGPKNDELFAPPKKKSYYSITDYQNMQEILKNMYYKKSSRKDVLKAMFKSIKNHLLMLK
jgi:hypothetical protein